MSTQYPQLGNQTSREEYINKHKIEPGVIDIIGLNTLRSSEILVSNYWNSGPLIMVLPEPLSSYQLGKLVEKGYTIQSLEKNEALAV